MKTWGKWITVVTLVSMFVLGVSSVGAQDTDPVRPGGRVIEIVINVVAEATGLSTDEILQQVGEGTTLLEILEAEGVDAEAVTADITEQVTAAIEQGLEDNVLNQRQADRLLERLPVMIEHMLNFCGLEHPGMGQFGGLGMRGEHRGFFGMMDEDWDGFFGMRGEGGRMFGGGMMGHHGPHR